MAEREGFWCAPHGRVGLGFEIRADWGKGGTLNNLNAMRSYEKVILARLRF